MSFRNWFLGLFCTPLALCLWTFALSVCLTPPTDAAGGLKACPDVWDRQPLVMYDKSGLTMLGPYHEHLVVYSSGFLSYTNVSYSGSRNKTAMIDARDADALLGQLLNLGAFEMCDQEIGALDVPLSTLTMLLGGTDAQAHTVNWWVPDESFSPIDAAIDDFVNLNVPR